jgi:hypothetical protein
MWASLTQIWDWGGEALLSLAAIITQVSFSCPNSIYFITVINKKMSVVCRLKINQERNVDCAVFLDC